MQFHIRLAAALVEPLVKRGGKKDLCKVNIWALKLDGLFDKGMFNPLNEI